MTISTDVNPSKQSRQVKCGAIHKILNFLSGSGEDNSETIKQIKKYLEVLEQKQQTIGNKLMRHLEMINESNIQISRNQAVINSLNMRLDTT